MKWPFPYLLFNGDWPTEPKLEGWKTIVMQWKDRGLESLPTLDLIASWLCPWAEVKFSESSSVKWG